MKCVFKHQDLQMIGIKFNKFGYILPIGIAVVEIS